MDLLDLSALALILFAGVVLAYQALTESWAINESVGWTVFWFGALLAVLPESAHLPVPLLERWDGILTASVMLIGISIRAFWQPDAATESA